MGWTRRPLNCRWARSYSSPISVNRDAALSTASTAACGPAYYLDRLPRDVEYYGFDTNEPYLAHARRKFGDRGVFRNETLTKRSLAELAPFDAVLLFGLLHHLSDDECAVLLDVAASVGVMRSRAPRPAADPGPWDEGMPSPRHRMGGDTSHDGEPTTVR